MRRSSGRHWVELVAAVTAQWGIALKRAPDLMVKTDSEAGAAAAKPT